MAESFVHEFQSNYEKLLISDPMTHGPLIVFLYIGLKGMGQPVIGDGLGDLCFFPYLAKLNQRLSYKQRKDAKKAEPSVCTET